MFGLNMLSSLAKNIRHFKLTSENYIFLSPLSGPSPIRLIQHKTITNKLHNNSKFPKDISLLSMKTVPLSFNYPQISLYSTTNQPSNQCSKKTENDPPKAATMTTRQKLKQAVAQYGSTVIVFHIAISLLSLGAFYTLLSKGIDLSVLLKYTKYIGLSEDSLNSKLATTTGTFAAAYLVHKVFAPVRLSITMAVAPFLVRYLRKRGWIKKAAQGNSKI